MNFNVCIVKPKNYPHSDAFWELSELLIYSLRDLKFDVILSVNEIIADRQNIVFGAHLLSNNDFPISTIIFNTEQLWNGVESWVEKIISLGHSYTIWDYNSNNIELLKGKNCNKVIKFEIGFHNKLNRIKQKKIKDIDVLFYGSLKERRKNLLTELSNSGLKVKHLFGVYGAQRDEYVSRAKIVLNCHHYNAKIFEIVRVHYLVNNSIPIVSELDTETKIDPFWQNIIFTVPYNEIVKECKRLSANESERNKISKFAFKELQSRPQIKFTQRLIENIG